MSNLKKSFVSLVLASGFILSVGAFSTTNAQDWRWNRQRRVEQRRGDWNRDGIPDRYETRRGQPDFNRNGIPDRVERNRSYYGNNGYYRNNGYYDNYGYYGNRGYGYNNGYGYNSSEVQRGYRDGLDRGQEDARDRRTPTPYNSEHFRKGSAAYREGFSRGYNVGYRQYGGRW